MHPSRRHHSHQHGHPPAAQEPLNLLAGIVSELINHGNSASSSQDRAINLDEFTQARFENFDSIPEAEAMLILATLSLLVTMACAYNGKFKLALMTATVTSFLFAGHVYLRKGQEQVLERWCTEVGSMGHRDGRALRLNDPLVQQTLRGLSLIKTSRHTNLEVIPNALLLSRHREAFFRIPAPARENRTAPVIPWLQASSSSEPVAVQLFSESSTIEDICQQEFHRRTSPLVLACLLLEKYINNQISGFTGNTHRDEVVMAVVNFALTQSNNSLEGLLTEVHTALQGKWINPKGTLQKILDSIDVYNERSQTASAPQEDSQYTGYKP